MKIITISIMLVLVCPALIFAQSNTDEIEQNIQEKVKDYLVEFYEGNPQNYAELFMEEGVFTMDEWQMEGKQEMIKIISKWPIQSTGYSVKFSPLKKVGSNYVMRYIFTEETGFSQQQVELWTESNGELKIAYANGVLIPPEGAGGMGISRMIISSLILGIGLFLLLVIYRNAKKRKSKASTL